MVNPYAYFESERATSCPKNSEWFSLAEKEDGSGLSAIYKCRALDTGTARSVFRGARPR